MPTVPAGDPRRPALTSGSGSEGNCRCEENPTARSPAPGASGREIGLGGKPSSAARISPGDGEKTTSRTEGPLGSMSRPSHSQPAVYLLINKTAPMVTHLHVPCPLQTSDLVLQASCEWPPWALFTEGARGLGGRPAPHPKQSAWARLSPPPRVLARGLLMHREPAGSSVPSLLFFSRPRGHGLRPSRVPDAARLVA